MEKSPKSFNFVAKLFKGKILIFDKDLKIINTIESSLKVAGIYTKSEIVLSGSKLITCGVNGTEYWEIPECKLTDTNTKPTKISTLAILPNNLLAAGGKTNGIIYIIQENGDISHELSLPGKQHNSIRSLLYVKGSEELWAGDGDGNIHIAEKSGTEYTLRTVQRVHKGYPGVLALKERTAHREVCSGGGNGGVGVWGYDGSLLYQIPLGGVGRVTSLSVVSGGYILIGGWRGHMELWDAAQDSQVRICSFRPHQDAIMGIQMMDSEVFIHSQGSQVCVSGSWDGTIKLLNPHKGEVLADLKVGDKVVGMANIYIN